MEIVGLVTFVTSNVGSKTSTCLRSDLGDMRVVSAPIVPGSSGGVPGQISTTCGPSATGCEHATLPAAAKKSIAMNRMMFSSTADVLVRRLAQQVDANHRNGRQQHDISWQRPVATRKSVHQPRGDNRRCPA